jgi:hypothetical protein
MELKLRIGLLVNAADGLRGIAFEVDVFCGAVLNCFGWAGTCAHRHVVERGFDTGRLLSILGAVYV